MSLDYVIYTGIYRQSVVVRVVHHTSCITAGYIIRSILLHDDVHVYI